PAVAIRSASVSPDLSVWELRVSEMVTTAMRMGMKERLSADEAMSTPLEGHARRQHQEQRCRDDRETAGETPALTELLADPAGEGRDRAIDRRAADIEDHAENEKLQQRHAVLRP